MKEKAPKTITGIAKDLGLAPTTVSSCLGGNARKYRIKRETEKRVVEYAQSIGFVPNETARNLALKKDGGDTIALLMSQSDGAEKNTRALNMAMTRLEQSGRSYVLQACHPRALSGAVRSLKGEGIKTIILFGVFNGREEQREEVLDDHEALNMLLQDMNLYIVDDCPPSYPSVLKNAYRMGVDRQNIYTDLFDQVLRNRDEVIADCGDRYCLSRGDFSAYLKEKNLPFDPVQYLELNQDIKNRFDAGKDLAVRLFSRLKEIPITVVFLHDDRVAAGMMDQLLRYGVKIPEELSVIGFDNIEAAPYFRIPLTSVSIPIEKHTQMALSSILDGVALPRVIVSKADIIWRESSRRLFFGKD